MLFHNNGVPSIAGENSRRLKAPDFLLCILLLPNLLPTEQAFCLSPPTLSLTPSCIFSVLAVTHPTPHFALKPPCTIHSRHYFRVQFSTRIGLLPFSTFPFHHLRTVAPLLLCSSAICVNTRAPGWMIAFSFLLNSGPFLMFPQGSAYLPSVPFCKVKW